MTVVVGTAGHIDHGKTSLLRALTGIDADRLPEERRRGMTIDVGYAHLRLPDGDEIDFVDVPGHDLLIGNMLVGAGEIDAALLVVAADDGPRAQTIEHLELLNALGISDGLAVVTKVDLAGAERTAAVVASVRELLRWTALAGIPVLAVSSTTGEGLDGVTAELARLRDRLVAVGLDGGRSAVDGMAPTSAPVRLAIDRAFSVRGRGLVVTGSLRGGRIGRDATLRLVPGGAIARARELQVHGAPVDSLEGGGRLAINLAGLRLDDVRRGNVLTSDPGIGATDRLIALIRHVARFDHAATPRAWPLEPAATYRLYLGTASIEARLRRGRRESAELPDGRWVVTLGLASPVAAAAGDRFVLRFPSPGATAAGGVVLDAAPPVGASRRRASTGALAKLAAAWETGAEAEMLPAKVSLHGLVRISGGEPPLERVPGARAVAGWWLDERLASDLEEAAEAVIRLHNDRGPHSPGLSLAQLRRELGRRLRRQATANDATALAIAGGIIDRLVDAGRLARRGDLVHDPGRSADLPAHVLEAMDRLEQALAVPAPPPLADAARAAGCPVEGIRALEASGRIVRLVDDLAWAAPTYRELEALAVRLATPRSLTPAALRDATGTSRKYVMALLEDLDRRGVLRRTPTGHVLGPRALR